MKKINAFFGGELLLVVSVFIMVAVAVGGFVTSVM